MQVHRLSLTREQLAAIPPLERQLLVLVAHALNEVNTFNRLTAVSTKHDRTHQWTTHFDATQTIVLTRTLVGKTYEAWVAIQETYHRSGLSKHYHSSLDQRARESAIALKKYFGPTNLLNTIRNSFAFHYSPENASTELPSAVVDDELVIYFHGGPGSTLYLFAEIVMNVALFDGAHPANPEEAFKRIIDEASEAIRHLNELGQALIVQVLERFVGEQTLRLSRVSLELPVARYEETRIPALMSMDPPPPAESDA